MSLKELNLSKILTPVEMDLQELDKRILTNISPSSRSLSKILDEIFKAGGKRIRPAISFLIAKAVSSSFNIEIEKNFLEKIFLVAEISELIHTASLVHDDIIDNSDLRRGHQTTNNKWGNSVSVISGDFMFARAAVNLSLLESNSVVKIYAEVLQNLCDGEIHQFEKQFSTEIDFDYYINKSYKKTASLFEASVRSVLELYKLDLELKDSISEYGKNLGLAFQFVDDLLDFSSDSATLGKPSFSDLREGQITLPILIAIKDFKAFDKESYQSLVSCLQQVSFDPESLHLHHSKIQDLLLRANAFTKSKNFIDKYLEMASNSLDALSNSIYKDSLLDLIDFVKNRKF